jgi:type I restriction enzyme S subunit
LIGDMYYEFSLKIEMNERLAECCDQLASAELSCLLQTCEKEGTLVMTRLGEVADVNPRTVKPTTGSLSYLDISSVSVGKAEPPIRMAWSDAPSRARRGVANGDVLWSTVRPNRRSHCLLLNPPSDLVVSTGFAVLTPKLVGPSFLYGMSERQEFVDYLVSVADGSTYPAVRADRFVEAPLQVPNRDALTSYESATMVLRERGAAARWESNLLLQLRDLLLRNLLSEGLPVSDAEFLGEETW